MRQIALVTDNDLVRSRTDPVFRHRLIAESLEMLLAELSRLRNSESDPEGAKQIREGVSLAVRLADILQRIEQEPETQTG
jgi:hypothetical protein